MKHFFFVDFIWKAHIQATDNMIAKTHQDILARIQKPSRYLGTEINCIRKDPRAVALKVALAFPDLYDIGTSHFGLQILYHILNQQDTIAAERVFAPAKDMEAQLRQHGQPLVSLENHLPVADFDIIGFSLLYELNYTNVLNMLDLAGVPLKWDQREEHHPLVIAGGPSVCNPEPMADFFDAMVFGDGELVVLALARQWLRWHQAGVLDKATLLRQWAQIPGVYVPRFYRAVYDEQDRQRLVADPGVPGTISRTVVADLDRADFPQRPIVPFGKPVHDRLRLEIARGCTRGCRFCQAGMIYRPVRERSPGRILDLTQQALSETGYEDLSLLSLSTGDYTCLTPLMEALMQHCQKDRVAVSLPSLRAGTLSPALMTLIQSVRKTGFTLAPEAGSQRLRNVINKNICFEDVAATVKNAFTLGWRVIKLYFMIGLPTETDQDLEAIIDMVRRLKSIKSPSGRRGQINVSVTTFIPKAHTPFQWAGQISLDQSRKKISFIKSELSRIRGVKLKWQDPNMSQLEGVLARGDRRLSSILIDAWKRGCTFDGWTDEFNFALWQKSFQHGGIDPEAYNARQRDLNEALPWAHLDSRVERRFFKTQWQEALAGSTVADCRQGQCHGCGVCDFDKLKPMVHDVCDLSGPLAGPLTGKGATEALPQAGTYQMVYEKMGPARFLGHLELNHLFGRAIRRAGIPVAYSQGFHPKPKISFDDPLPLGIESEGELMRLKLQRPLDGRKLVERLNPFLPDGINVVHCRLKVPGAVKIGTPLDRYRVVFDQPVVDLDQLATFTASERWDHERFKPKGRTRTIDLRAGVASIISNDGQTIDMTLQNVGVHTLRPLDVLQGVFALSQELIQTARITKRAAWKSDTKVDKPAHRG